MTVEIIKASDSDYIRFCNRSDAIRHRERAGGGLDPINSDLGKAYKALEDATLGLLSQVIGMELDCLLKALRDKPHPVFGDYDYHQLDGIIRIDDVSICFCEIKITSSLHWAFKSAKRQLRKRLDLCHLRWRNSFGCAACFSFSSPETESSSANFLTFDDFVGFLRADHAPQTVSRVIVDAESLKASLDNHQLNGTALFNEISDLKHLLENPNSTGVQALQTFSNSLSQAFDQLGSLKVDPPESS